MHLRVALDAVQAALRVFEGGDRRVFGVGRHGEAHGGRLDRVAVAHPHRLDRSEATEETAAADLHGRPPVLAPRRAADAPAEALRDPHHSVAEPEDGDLQVEEARVALRSFLVVDARRAARQDDSLRCELGDLLGLRVKRKDDRADTRLAYPPGDDPVSYTHLRAHETRHDLV